jgi:PEP-CTERM motif-containing protein
MSTSRSAASWSNTCRLFCALTRGSTGTAGLGTAGAFSTGFSGLGGGGGGGGGGGSYLARLFTDPVLTAGANSGDGSISVELLKAVPEPSTWAMMLMGFAGLGWLARTRGRKTSPA